MSKLAFFTAIMALKYASSQPIQWSDCSRGLSTEAITWHNFDIQPNPIQHPGKIDLTFSMTVNRQINHLFVDYELKKKNTLFGETKIPCIKDVGSCTSVMFCSIMTEISNNASRPWTSLSSQMLKLLLKTSNQHMTCPLIPQKVKLFEGKLVFPEIPLGSTFDGDYHATIKVREDPTSADYVSCLDFNFTLGQPAPDNGLLVGKK